MLNEANKREFQKRLRSLGWKVGSMLAVALLDFIAVNLSLFNLPDVVVVVGGLLVSELTKYLSNLKLGRVGRKTE